MKRLKKRKTVTRGDEIQVAGKGAGVQRLPSWLSRDLVFGLILFLTVILTYQPIWHAGFIWDDDDHVTANPCIIGPLGLKEIWTTSAARYYPLVLTTFWVEHALWGLNPLFFHLVNVLMHGACAIALWRVLRSLQIPGAWLGAALWALHPVQVETVAWITELKNTQSCLFYLLSIFFFVKELKARETDDRGGRRWNYALTLLFAALAMTSKSSTVVLPVVLCLCAWWVEGQWYWRNLVKVMPIFLMSAAAAALAMWSVELYGGVHDPHWARSWPERLVTTGDVPWFYLGKLLWPHPLVFIYPRWQINAGQGVSYLPLVAMLAVLLILWVKRQSWSRPYFFAFAYFLAALLPVLGLVNHYFLRFSFVADHLQYLASMGPLALAGAGLTCLAGVILPGRFWLQTTLCAGLLLILGILSWQRTWVYESVDTLWTDTLAQNPNCWIAHMNFGSASLQRGQLDEAIEQFREVLKINPNFTEAYYDLGIVFTRKGERDKAIEQYKKALEIDPNYVLAHNNLGIILFQKGQVDDAISQYQKASEMDPTYAGAHVNLGTALLQQGQVGEAIAQFQKAFALDPYCVAAHYSLGKVLLQKGEVDEAIEQFQKTLEINPNFTEAHNDLGTGLLQKGKVDEAIAQFQKTLAINPNHVDAQFNLGIAFLLKGQVDEAIAQYQKALKINPTHAVGHGNLGVALFQKGRIDEAIAQYQKALEISPDFADAHYNLGNAFARKGHLKEAISQYQEAVRLMPGNNTYQQNLAIAKTLLKQGTPAGK